MPVHITSSTLIGQRRLQSQSQGQLQIPSYTGYNLIQSTSQQQQQQTSGPHNLSLHNAQSQDQIKMQSRNRGEPLSPPLSAGHIKTTFQDDFVLPDPLNIDGGHVGYVSYQDNNLANSHSNGHTHQDIATHSDLHNMNLARTSKVFHVIIVGGAFAGIRAAQELEQLLPPHMITITVIEKRDQYFYNLGALRTMVKPELIDIVWLPYTNIFKYPHNRVVKGEVTAVYPNAVILKDGRKMDFDSLLVSIGSIYPQPCKLDTTSHVQGKAEMRMYAEILREAESILIIGGGPTGVGLAAEIATEYHNKTVILVHAGSRLLQSEYTSESMSRKALKKLKALGVKVFLNERVNIPNDEPLTYRIECRWLKTSKGRMLFSNFQVLCNGITFNTSMMNTLDPLFTHKLIDNRTGQIRVLPTMQIEHPELPWIFSAGDVCNTSGEKQAYRADSQGSHVARCMARMAQAWAHGNPQWFNVPLKQWHDPAQFMSVAMGPSAGVTDTPWIVLGDLPTRIMKSRELFLQRRYREFNLEFPGVPKRKASSSNNSSNSSGKSGNNNVLTRSARDDDRFIRSAEDIRQAQALVQAHEQAQARVLQHEQTRKMVQAQQHHQQHQQQQPLFVSTLSVIPAVVPCPNSSSSHRNIEQRIRARGGVATNIENPAAYELTQAMARAAITTADNLDGQFENDRVSLSRPPIHHVANEKDAFPYAAFYGNRQHSATNTTTDSELSEGYTSEDEENVNRIIREANARSRYISTPPLSTVESTVAPSDSSATPSAAPSEHKPAHESLSHYSEPANQSKISVSTASTSDSVSSSASSRAPSFPASLMSGPVLPRHKKKERDFFKATRRLFRSRDAILEEPYENESSMRSKSMHPDVLPRMSSVMPTSIPKKSTSNLTINLQQL
ncbi:hypothetical protein LPJ64_000204 [Coemansia asiatica]|uniref:FAD/NAD(P)-binding domain-containing protein n=1 Tax=Coemansia asiatica TaxID=1052880 RepID=A0A9W8CLR1_9FUNG|nr:hypothetical protein LPJ64_000204 [Coemansia asiatica]